MSKPPSSNISKKKSRAPVQPSSRTLQQMLNRHAELINSMAVHLRVSRGMTPPQELDSPKPLLFVAVRKAAVKTFIQVARSHTARAWEGVVVLRWRDGLLATLKIAYLRSTAEKQIHRWIPLTLASGTLAQTLLRKTKRESLQKLSLLVVPSLRLQAIVRFTSGGSAKRTQMAVTFIQPGITRLSHRHSMSLQVAERRFSEEIQRLSTHLNESA